MFKAYEEDNAFVGHTGILIDCRENEGVNTDYSTEEGSPKPLVYKDNELLGEL